MMLYPEVQKKIQEEIDRVIGSDRFITMEDKPSLHYISATCQVGHFIVDFNGPIEMLDGQVARSQVIHLVPFETGKELYLLIF